MILSYRVVLRDVGLWAEAAGIYAICDMCRCASNFGQEVSVSSGVGPSFDLQCRAIHRASVHRVWFVMLKAISASNTLACIPVPGRSARVRHSCRRSIHFKKDGASNSGWRLSWRLPVQAGIGFCTRRSVVYILEGVGGRTASGMKIMAEEGIVEDCALPMWHVVSGHASRCHQIARGHFQHCLRLPLRLLRLQCQSPRLHQ